MLLDELKRIEALADSGSPDVIKEIESLTAKYNTEEDKAVLGEFASRLMSGARSKMDEIEELTVKEKLGELNEAINMAYVARRYFGKSKSWLYQRIKGNIVNNKRACFSESELVTFNMAMSDIGSKTLAFKL